MIDISEYGIKIKNIEAATLYEYNLGVRDHYDYKDAMLTNSLFKDFLVENGLNVYDSESTRDIICIEFNFGTRTYDEELKHIHKIAVSARDEYKSAKSHGHKAQIEKKYNKRKKISRLYQDAIDNKDLYTKLSKDELRNIFYTQGVDVPYIYRNKHGEQKEIIHYKMLYRSTGKAKKGTCMFIREELYERAKNFLYMDIELPATNAPIVEASAYIPLISSGIVGTIEIPPENILVVDDVDRFFTTNVISIETDKKRHCKAIPKDNYKLKNTMFDGQALIDESIFPEWGDGYILLRHHFCKMAAFNTKIQKFMKYHFGDDYSSAYVKDMFGRDVKVSDIKLITTDNALKWLKFNISFEYWAQKVRDNGSKFGIVKTAHPSKLGNVQRMSYQMVNALDENIMDSVMKESKEYIVGLKSSDEAFLEYLKNKSDFSNDYEALYAICKQNPEFTRCDYFRKRKKKIIEAYIRNMKSGRLIQNADNLVIVGSPYAMLLHSVGVNVDEDPTFKVEENVIQCWTNRFADDEYLAEFRSPFNSSSNLGYLHNVYHEYFDKYFNFGKLIIAVNMNGTNFQDKNNGLTNWASVQKCA